MTAYNMIVEQINFIYDLANKKEFNDALDVIESTESLILSFPNDKKVIENKAKFEETFFGMRQKIATLL